MLCQQGNLIVQTLQFLPQCRPIRPSFFVYCGVTVFVRGVARNFANDDDHPHKNSKNLAGSCAASIIIFRRSSIQCPGRLQRQAFSTFWPNPKKRHTILPACHGLFSRKIKPFAFLPARHGPCKGQKTGRPRAGLDPRCIVSFRQACTSQKKFMWSQGPSFLTGVSSRFGIEFMRG